MKYVRPTQWPEWWWHFQTHSSMNVYTVWKKIDQRARFRKRHRNQNPATKINLFRKAGGESRSGLEKLASECEALNSNNDDVGVWFILVVRDTLLFFRISENITSKSWGFSFHGVTHDISGFFFKSFRFHPCFAPSFPPLLYDRIQKDFKVIGEPGRLRAGSHLCLIQSLKEIVQRRYSSRSCCICHRTSSYLV